MNTRRWITAALAGAVGLGLTGAISAGHLQRLPTLDRMPGAEIVDELTSWQPTPNAPAEPTGTAAQQLEQLAPAQDAPPTRYDRDAFGQRWADIDRNGCDQRNDTLRTQLEQVQTKPGTRGCKVLSGTLTDPYTGQQMSFTAQDPQAVQIDHAVSLANAWDHGAWQWNQQRREQFANDPGNLLAVDGPTNQAKSDADASQWLPQNPAGRCELVTRQIRVKTQWSLTVTGRERAAMREVLAGCQGPG